MNLEKKKIVVTGLGPISSIGIGKENLWNNLLNAKVSISDIDCFLEQEKWVSFKKFKVKNFDIKNFNLDTCVLNDIKAWKQQCIDEDLLYLFSAIQLSIKDAGIEYDRENNSIGLVVTHENPGLEYFFTDIMEKTFNFFQTQLSSKIGFSKIDYFKTIFKEMLKPGFDMQTFMYLFHIQRMFGLHGYSLFINNACASGAYALEEAKRIIHSGVCEVVIVVGSDIPDIYKYLWFESLGMSSVDYTIRPFSKKANGFLVGDGAAALVLESFNHAKKRSAKIYGEYLGGGFASEGWKVAFPNVTASHYANAIKNAFKESGIDPDLIDLWVPHGVATRVTDKFEIKTIEKFFNTLGHSPSIVALKPYVGHNLGGNVLLETVIMLLMLNKNCLLPTLNVAQSDLITNLNVQLRQESKQLEYALKTTCAFAGFDSAIIFKKTV